MSGITDATDLEAGLAELDGYRSSIDNLDSALIALLAERFKITQQVGKLKVRLNLPSADPSREQAQIQRLQRLATDAKLDPVFAEKILTFIIAEVVRHHDSIARDSRTTG